MAATPTTHVTLYFDAAPAGAPNLVQIANASPKYPVGSSDVKILNFALAVETIEAERYRQTIARLTTGGTDMFGNPIIGLGVSPAELDVQLLTGFYATEGQQRDFIASTLYGSPAANPFLDQTQYLYDYAINTLDRTMATMGVYVAETIGVGAYLGGSGLLAVESPFLAPSASFLGVEARHAASLAYALNALSGTGALQTAPLSTDTGVGNAPGVDTALTADQVLNSKGKVATGLLPATGGVTPAISGPAGFVYRPS